MILFSSLPMFVVSTYMYSSTEYIGQARGSSLNGLNSEVPPSRVGRFASRRQSRKSKRATLLVALAQIPPFHVPRARALIELYHHFLQVINTDTLIWLAAAANWK